MEKESAGRDAGRLLLFCSGWAESLSLRVSVINKGGTILPLSLFFIFITYWLLINYILIYIIYKYIRRRGGAWKTTETETMEASKRKRDDNLIP